MIDIIQSLVLDDLYGFSVFPTNVRCLNLSRAALCDLIRKFGLPLNAGCIGFRQKKTPRPKNPFGFFKKRT
ncbi:hypothetical protein, partial [Cohnella sp.]|uniref:hypothetical protein n=1 Tax=Cohnella sp. TaxID=1883426 RepID=UPI0037043D42